MVSIGAIGFGLYASQSAITSVQTALQEAQVQIPEMPDVKATINASDPGAADGPGVPPDRPAPGFARIVQEFGAKGDGPGQFNNAHGIAVGPDGHLYVADRENGRVQWFDLSGTLLGVRTYGGQFYNIAFDSTGGMWAAVHPKGVSLDEEFQVVHFDLTTGRMLGRVP